MNIKVKDTGVMTDLLGVAYDRNLINIVVDVASAHDVFFTCGYREGDNGVHGTVPCRGVDLRSRIYEEAELQKIADKINAKWSYDHNRPNLVCCYIHGKDYNRHIHLQSHPNTRRIG